MRDAEYAVHDDHGREIGSVLRGGLGWRSIALDGANLGSYPDREDAHAAIRLDWTLGRPRNPRTHERYRPVHSGTDAGIAPVYLGR